MSDPKKTPCLCSSGKSYEECCQPFHEGKLPENALQLMRSRYCAYARCLPDYIMRTTHPDLREKDRLTWRQRIIHFSRTFQFHRLKVHDFQEEDKRASVTFTAFLSQEGRDASFTEKSEFKKVKGQWLYQQGEAVNGPAR